MFKIVFTLLENIGFDVKQDIVRCTAISSQNGLNKVTGISREIAFI